MGTRGTQPPSTQAEIEGINDLVKNAPEGFEYIEKFFVSCSNKSTEQSTEEVFFECMEDGECDEEELAKYGDIYVQFLRYTTRFFLETKLPAVTPDWEQETERWFGEEGWTWWEFSARILRDYY